MKKLIFLSLLFFSINSYSQTQLSMNQSASSDFQNADKTLNSVYQSILKIYSNDPLFLQSLKNAQRAWIAFRDAQLLMKYPNTEHNYYGSVGSMCKDSYLADLTNQRIKELRVWIVGIEEGDVCSGSVRRKD